VTAQIDPARVSFGALITGAGGLLLLLATFIDWVELANAWKLYTFVDLLLVIVALVAIATAVMQLLPDPPAVPFHPGEAALFGGVFALGVAISAADAANDSKFGLVLTILASLVVIVGGVLARREPVTGYGRGVGAATAQPTVGTAGQPAGAEASSPPADWYPDPRGEARLRYWDGSQWTDQTAD
jgi:uncharacterized membrane protein